MPNPKLVRSWGALQRLVKRLHRQGKTIALTNGCFDLLHVGHLRSLQDARRQADCLLVAINSDVSARKYKGKGHPVMPAAERAELLGGFACVDYVFVFNEPTADRLLRAVRPRVYCKGPEYTMKNLPERETLRNIGSVLVRVGDPKNHSSTLLRRKIAHLHGGSRP